MSGLTGQVRNERIGRRRSCLAPPAMAAAMSIILRAQKPMSGPMVACLVVFVKMASALCSAAVSGGTSWAPSGRSTTSISGRASMILRAVGDVLLAALVQLAGVRVDDLDALAEVGEADAAVLEHDVPGRVAAAQTTVEGAERTASSTRCAGRRTTFVSRSTSAPAAAKISRASSSSTKTPVRDSTSSVAPMDLAQLVVGEHLEPEAAALARSRARVPDHRQPPAVRSLNFSTLLIGTSSTRAMLNFASI